MDRGPRRPHRREADDRPAVEASKRCRDLRAFSAADRGHLPRRPGAFPRRALRSAAPFPAGGRADALRYHADVTQSAWWRRFFVRGVFWRQLLRFGILNVPPWIEPIIMAFWSTFFLVWGPGRRGVMRNLKVIKPGSFALANVFRCYRVFWNYAWTIADNVRFKELRTIPDWEFTGREYFEEMQTREGAILLTAHM